MKIFLHDYFILNLFQEKIQFHTMQTTNFFNKTKNVTVIGIPRNSCV